MSEHLERALRIARSEGLEENVGRSYQHARAQGWSDEMSAVLALWEWGLVEETLLGPQELRVAALEDELEQLLDEDASVDLDGGEAKAARIKELKAELGYA